MAAGPPPPSSIQDLVYSFMPAQILRVGVQLRIADELVTGPRTAAELAETTGTHPPSLRRLLRALACLGVLTEPEPDLFELAPAGRQLRADVPDSIRSAVLLFTSDEVWRSWGQLEYSVRTGRIAWDHVIGSSVFEFMGTHPEQSATFNAAMADRARLVAPQIAAGYDFSRFASLVDVGGGDGALLAAILGTAPNLRGVLFDRSVGPVAIGTLRAAGVADRCEVVSGDFFAGVPEGAGAYLLKSVIHNWDDERAGTILGNCRKAMPDNATLLVVERVLPAVISSPVSARAVFSDINMMVNTFGRERTAAEFSALFAVAGFALDDIIATSPDPSGYQILVGRPT